MGFGAMRLRHNMDYLVVWFGGLLFLFLYSLQTLEGFVLFPEGAGYSLPKFYMGLIGAGMVMTATSYRLYGNLEYLLGQRDVLRGNQRFVSQDFNGALLAFNSAIKTTHGAVYDDVPWYSKGAVLIKMGRYEEAMACINRALRINPRNEITWNSRGNALVKLNQYYKGMRCFDEALGINPRYEVAWNNKGNLYARLRRYDEAVKCYNRAIELEPSYKDAWVNKGYVLVRMGRFKEAVTCADMAGRRAA